MSSCASTATEPTTSAESSVDTSTTSSAPTDPPPGSLSSWVVGPEYVAETFQVDGETRSGRVTLRSFNSTSFSLDLGACGYGGTADFDINDNRLTLPSGFGQDGGECPKQPADQIANGQALEALLLSQPDVVITDDSITIENESAQLTLTTEDATTDMPAAPTGVWFRGVATNSNEIDAATVAVQLPALFAIDIQLETCLLHGGIGSAQPDQPRDTITAIRLDDCPTPSPSDQATIDLLTSTPTLAFDGQQLTVTAPTGIYIALE